MIFGSNNLNMLSYIPKTGWCIDIISGTGYDSSDIVKNRYIVKDYKQSNTIQISIIGSWNGEIPDTTTKFKLFFHSISSNFATYYKESPSIDSIKLTSYGIIIYGEINEGFYNSYLPYRFGDKINTPNDRGWYMINFNYLPGEHQPSGHINLSLANETYLTYTSSFINEKNPVDLIVLSDTINFLLIKNGSAILRYTT